MKMACDYDYPQRRNKRKNKRKEKKKHPYKKGGIQRTSKFLGTK